MENLKITARLGSAVASDFELPLDSVLAAAWIRKHFPDVFYNSGKQHSFSKIEAELPLTRFEKKGCSRWIWSASWAVWDNFTQSGESSWTKKFDMKESDRIDFKKKRGTIDTQSGYFRGYNMPIYYRSTLSLTWYAHGDKQGVQELLNTISHIGKKRSQGWGLVRAWIVEEAGENWSTWKEGNAMRPIPTALAPDLKTPHDLQVVGYLPPYWLPENQTLCVIPNR